jgi:hypothetical protein
MGEFDLGPGHCHKMAFGVKCLLGRNSRDTLIKFALVNHYALPCLKLDKSSIYAGSTETEVTKGGIQYRNAKNAN